MKFSPIFLALFFFNFFFSNSVGGMTQDKLEAQIVIENYIDAVFSYCKNYDDSHRFFIENHLLVDPNINVGNDLSENLNEKYQANWYFIDIKKQGVAVSYNPNFEIETCKALDGSTFIGGFMQKTLVYPNGKIIQYQELIELEKGKENNWRIKNIASGLFQDLSKYKLGTNKKTTQSENANMSSYGCSIEKQANDEYKNKNFERALKYYMQALNCSNDKKAIEERIIEIQEDQKTNSVLISADAHFQKKDYEKALSDYQLIISKGIENLSQEEIDMLGKRISECKQEIEINRLIQDADYFFAKGAYNRALPLYEEVLSIDGDNETLKSKFLKCKSFAEKETKEKQLEKLKTGVSLIQANKLNEGFSVLLRHRDTGLLNEEHLFYMAQILDTRPKSVRKEFGINKVDCCVLTRQFMVEARSLGAASEDFNFFWDAHFNKKSRSCIH